MRRSTRGRSNPNPPSDSSATTETAEQRARRVYYENLTTRMQAFSTDHPICRRVPIFFTPSGLPHPVEEVAKNLVGLFLISRENEFVMQIVETEAYSENEQIYRIRFPEPPPDFRNAAGRLVSYKFPYGKKCMLITAGADNSRDLVLLRACIGVLNTGEFEIAERMNLRFPMTNFQLLNMMSAPTKIAMALTPELRSDDYNNLLTASRGLYLARPDPKPPIPLIKLAGPRILPKDTADKSYSAMPRANFRLRFALHTRQTIALRSKLFPIQNQP